MNHERRNGMRKVKLLITGILITVFFVTTIFPAYVDAAELREISVLETGIESAPVVEEEPEITFVEDENTIRENIETDEEYTANGDTDNLLKNGNGETGNIDGWKHDYPGFNTLYQAQEKSEFYNQDNVSAHSGKYCLVSDVFIECYHDFNWKLSPYLKFTEENPNDSEVELYQDVDISGIPAGTELILRGYVNQTARMGANFYDRSGNLLSENNAKDRSITDDTKWKYQRLSVKIPNNAGRIRIRLISEFHRFKGGYGDPYAEYTWGAFDDVSLRVKKPSDYKPVMANTTGEILQNGGGESGNTSGWFYEYEDFTVFHSTGKTDFYSRTDVNPHSGSYCLASDFYWELAKTQTHEIGDYYLGEILVPGTKKAVDSSVTMYQEVDLSPLPSGTKLTLSGYVVKEADISLTFYDAGRNQIGSTSAKLDEVENWEKRTVTTTIPANARYARVNLIAAYHGAEGGYGDPLGEYTRGAFDDISLKAVAQKAANPLKVTTKKRSYTVKYSKLKKSKKTIKGTAVYKFTKKGQGKITYKLSSAKKGKKSYKRYFTVNGKNGNITLRKGLKGGKYTVVVKVKAAGNNRYKAGSKNVKVTVKVK